MNELHMIFIIKSSHFKLVISMIISSSLSQSNSSHSNTLQTLKSIQIKNGNPQNPKIIEKDPNYNSNT
jgi:hypothetical protein